MNISITLDDNLVHGRSLQQLQQDIQEALILLDYIRADISLEKFAELMGIDYVQARNWLHQRGISTLRHFKDSELVQVSEVNYRRLADKLGINIGQVE
jgi:predicted HTH domain antitoxin